MAIGRAALLRPIEITASSDSFSTTVSGITVGHTMEAGTYASILTLARGFYDKLSGLAGFAVSFSTSGATAGIITISSSATFAVTWTDTELRDIFGFAGNLSGQTSYTATYRPKYTWISDYTPRDREWWHLLHRDTYNGSVARNGDLVGLANGNQIYHRSLGFDAETGANVFNSLTGSTAAERYTLETMIEGARGSSPATATNAPTHGLWYVYDIADLAKQSKTEMSSAKGMKHGLSKWAWCHLDKDGMKEPKASLGVGRDWYSLEIDLHTADEPTWNAPTEPS